MEFLFVPDLEHRKASDLLVVPVWQEKKLTEFGCKLPSKLASELSAVLETGDFKGKEGELLYLYLKDQVETRVVLLGLGSRNDTNVESLRKAYSSITKSCLTKRLSRVNVLVPDVDGFPEDLLIQGIVEGLLLPNYLIGRYQSPVKDEKDAPSVISKVTFIGPYKHLLPVANKALAICEAVYYARDLVNSNADDVTPQYLEACANGLAKQHPKVKVTLFNKKRIEKENLGLLLAVNRGSALDPAFIILEYRGQPKSKDHTVLIGKGITYDTGGLNIKTTGMETMKCDMAGAATCLGVIMAISSLGLKVNVTAVIPATENGVDAKSFKPGDVYMSYLGKTVEMTNSDAEGRLILADALAYAVDHLKPTRLINFATLTGGIDIALGAEASGLMANDDRLAEALQMAGKITSERAWRMPLYEEYKDKLKSDIADIKSWNGRSATSCVAATFLQEFVGNIPWAHFDIASTAYITEAKKYLPKYGTGVGVRLMVEFLESLSDSKADEA